MEFSKEAGINMVQTYAFWNIHEPVFNEYDFETGRRNITRFLDVCAEAGMLVNLRIGPYICAEWDLGGIPGWIRNIDGMDIRTINQPWQYYMKRFLQKVLDVVQPYLSHNGGPIVLLQVENEYGNVEIAYPDHTAYIEWCAETAVELEPNEIWMMCVQDDAPDSVIHTCNGFYCQDWIKPHKGKGQPAMFTEDWPGWFTAWGQPRLHRPVEDVSYSVAAWIAMGGSHINYYMWHGGTNFARTAANNFVTSYDYDTT
eukprot:UN28909